MRYSYRLTTPGIALAVCFAVAGLAAEGLTRTEALRLVQDFEANPKLSIRSERTSADGSTRFVRAANGAEYGLDLATRRVRSVTYPSAAAPARPRPPRTPLAQAVLKPSPPAPVSDAQAVDAATAFLKSDEPPFLPRTVRVEVRPMHDRKQVWFSEYLPANGALTGAVRWIEIDSRTGRVRGSHGVDRTAPREAARPPATSPREAVERARQAAGFTALDSVSSLDLAWVGGSGGKSVNRLVWSLQLAGHGPKASPRPGHAAYFASVDAQTGAVLFLSPCR